MPRQAREELEAIPTWQRRTFNLQHYRNRCERRNRQHRTLIENEASSLATIGLCGHRPVQPA